MDIQQRFTLRINSTQPTQTPRRYYKMNTGFCVPQNSERQEVIRYSKPIIPIQKNIKPFSSKNLEAITTTDSLTTLDEEFQDNKSCHCQTCGVKTSKMKSLSNKFKPFRPKMHITKEIRRKLLNRFRNAVRLLMWLIQRNTFKRQKKLKENTRKMFRLKTKVFDPSAPNGNFMFINKPEHTQQDLQTETDKSPLARSMQSKLFEQKSKARQSLQNYLSTKLNENDTFKTESLLPKVQQNSKMLDQLKQKLSYKQIPILSSARLESPSHKKSNSSPYLLSPPSLTMRGIQDIKPFMASPIKPYQKPQAGMEYLQKTQNRKLKKATCLY